MLEVEHYVPKKVLVIDKKGNTEAFDSVLEASKALGCTRSYVYQALKNGRKIAGCEVKQVD